MLLSILIPTKDRPNEISSLMRSLIRLIKLNNLEQDIELVISNNSRTQMEYQDKEFIKIINTNGIYLTAEENLFSLLRIAKGTYVWALGDDEIPIQEGFNRLVELCKEEKYDAMVWNSRIIGIEGEPLGHSRLSLNKNELKISYKQFLERTGYWSVAAGISLTVFKNDLNNFEFLNKITELKSPIYSHVTYYAYIFNQKEFAFVNYDLVLYQTNRHDVIKVKENHWEKHSKEQDYFYRYPWTLGFIRQLKLLEEEEIIGTEFFDKILDISHFGRRFKLAENSLSLLIEQRLYELQYPKSARITPGELIEILGYYQDHLPRFTRTYELLMLTADSNNDMNNKIKSQKLTEHLKFLKQSWDRLPFYGYYRFLKNHFLYFDTPLGWVAIKPELSNIDSTYLVNGQSNDFDQNSDLSQKLIWALGGLEIPSNFKYFADSLTDLEKKIALEENSLKASRNSEIAFFLAPEKYANIVYTETSRARRIWNKLPFFVRKFLKKFLFS